MKKIATVSLYSVLCIGTTLSCSCSNSPSAKLTGHTDDILCLVFAPDGRTLATASRDRTVRLWDLQTKKELSVLRGHRSAISSLAFSSDGKLLASGSHDGAVKIWETKSAKELASLSGHWPEMVNALVFSPDGSILASGGDDRVIRLWKVATGKEHGILEDDYPVMDLATNSRGTVLISRSYKGVIRLWDLQKQKELKRLAEDYDGLHDPCYRLALSPDEKTIATNFGIRMKIWDVKTGKEGTNLIAADLRLLNICAFTYSPDGRVLAVGGLSGKMVFWDVDTGKLLSTVRVGKTSSVAFSRDGKILATTDGSVLKLWETAKLIPASK